MTDRTWFSRLLRHPVRKWRGSIMMMMMICYINVCSKAGS